MLTVDLHTTASTAATPCGLGVMLHGLSVRPARRRQRRYTTDRHRTAGSSLYTGKPANRVLSHACFARVHTLRRRHVEWRIMPRQARAHTLRHAPWWCVLYCLAKRDALGARSHTKKWGGACAPFGHLSQCGARVSQLVLVRGSTWLTAARALRSSSCGQLLIV